MATPERGLIFVGFLFVGMLVFIEVGRRLAARRIAMGLEKRPPGIRAVEGAVFGLLGLLITFTFSGALLRFDGRRQLVIQEANNIGTAYLRINLLPPTAQPALREMFREYLDLRIETYRKLPDLNAARAVLSRSNKLQHKIWNHSVDVCRESGSSPAHMLLLPALNQMIDITTTRTEVTRIHPPPIIYAMLMAVSLSASLLAGFGMAEGTSRTWLHVLAFTITVTFTVYVIIDIEHPRLGLVSVESSDEVLVDLRKHMD